MKWTEQHTLKFVQEYIKYECLYNVKCAEFKNKRLRDAALLKLSEAMEIPDFGPKEAYNKIRSLKSTFSQEHKKVKDSIKSGAGIDDIYVPNIKWYKVMDDALKAVNVGECRETSSNMVSIPYVLCFFFHRTTGRQRKLRIYSNFNRQGPTDSERVKENTKLFRIHLFIVSLMLTY